MNVRCFILMIIFLLTANIEAKPQSCLPIRSFVLVGVTRLSVPLQQALIAEVPFACVTRRTIEQFLLKINRTYFEKGYITSKAFIAPQTLQDGQLVVTVIEGVVESYSFDQHNWRNRVKSWAAFPKEKGGVLNFMDIVQGITNLQNAPSASPSIQISPGSAFGKSIVNIHNQTKDYFRIHLGYDNEGTAVTGPQRFRVGIAFDNVFSMSDTWEVAYLGSLESHALTFAGDIPFRNWHLNIGTNYSEYFTELKNGIGLLTRTRADFLILKYLFFRDRCQKLFANIGFFKKKTNRQLDMITLTPQYLSILQGGVHYEHQQKDFSFLNFLGISQGLPVWGADKDQENLTAEMPRAQFTRFEWQARVQQQLEQLTLSSQMASVFSFYPLYNSERIALGGVHSVRGFETGAFLGDIGFSLQNEMQFQSNFSVQKREPQKMALFPYIFFDVGVAKDKVNPPTKTLGSFGIGFRYHYRHFLAELTLAKAMISRLLSPQLFHFNIEWSF